MNSEEAEMKIHTLQALQAWRCLDADLGRESGVSQGSVFLQAGSKRHISHGEVLLRFVGAGGIQDYPDGTEGTMRCTGLNSGPQMQASTSALSFFSLFICLCLRLSVSLRRKKPHPVMVWDESLLCVQGSLMLHLRGQSRN